MTQAHPQHADQGAKAALAADPVRQHAQPSAGPSGSHLQRERAALNHVVGRLTHRFPELRFEEIERAVFRVYAQFETSRIRDFVPILVERITREDLNSD